MRKCNECKNRVIAEQTVTKDGSGDSTVYACRKWACEFEPKNPVVRELDKEHIFYNGRQYIGLKRFLEVANKVPKVGKWLMPDKYYDKKIWRKCSVCNTHFELYSKYVGFSGVSYTRRLGNYCQVCGAKMESEENG
jgi:hypothetical protein